MSIDPKLADFLNRNGYAYEFVIAHPIDGIDLREADENPARLTRKLDTTRATKYGCDMLDGASFPGVLLHEIVGKKLKNLLNGRHRIKGAIEADIIAFDAYVVREPDPYRIDILLRFTNCMEGTPPTESDNLIQIAEMREKYPDKGLRDLAKITGLHTKTIDNFLKQRAAEDRADNLGIGSIFRSKAISPGMKLELHKITNENSFLAATQLIAKYEDLQKGGDGTRLVKEIAKCTTEKKALELLMTADKERMDKQRDQERKRMRAPSSRATKLVSAGRKVMDLTNAGIAKVHLAGLGGLSELQRAKAVISTARDRLEAAEEELDRLIAETEAEAVYVAGARRFATTSSGISPPA